MSEPDSLASFYLSPDEQRTFFEFNPFPYFVISGGAIVGASARFHEVTGYRNPDLRGHLIEDFLVFADAAATYDYHRQKLRYRDRTFEYECGVRCRDGQVIQIVLTMNIVLSRGICIGALRDVSRERQLQADLSVRNAQLADNARALEQANSDLRAALVEVSRLARIDPLTGLLNRRAFDELFEHELSRSLRQGHGLGLVMFDLDHFKDINDTLGHAEGDRVLVRFGEILTAAGRVIDIAARIGGEEFVTLLTDTDLNGAAAYAERVRAQQEAHGLHTTVSAGIACAPGHGEDRGGLFRAVDEALYRAKRAGRNQALIAEVAGR